MLGLLGLLGLLGVPRLHSWKLQQLQAVASQAVPRWPRQSSARALQPAPPYPLQPARRLDRDGDRKRTIRIGEKCRVLEKPEQNRWHLCLYMLHVIEICYKLFRNQPIKSHRLSVGVPRCPQMPQVSPCFTMSHHVSPLPVRVWLPARQPNTSPRPGPWKCLVQPGKAPTSSDRAEMDGEIWPLACLLLDTHHLEATNINKPVQSHSLNHLNPQNIHRDSKTATCCPPTAMANLPKSSKIFQDLPSIWLATRSFSRNVPKASVACECEPSPDVTRCHQLFHAADVGKMIAPSADLDHFRTASAWPTSGQ